MQNLKNMKQNRQKTTGTNKKEWLGQLMVPKRSDNCPYILVWGWQAMSGLLQLLPNFSWVLHLSSSVQFSVNTEYSQLQLKSGRTVLLTQMRFSQSSVLCLRSWDYFSDDSRTSWNSEGDRTLIFVDPTRRGFCLWERTPQDTVEKSTGINKIRSYCSSDEGTGQLHEKTRMGALN